MTVNTNAKILVCKNNISSFLKTMFNELFGVRTHNESDENVSVKLVKTSSCQQCRIFVISVQR